MAAWVVPIGRALGINTYADDFAVHLGGSVETLDEFELIAWGAVSGLFSDQPEWLDPQTLRDRLTGVFAALAPSIGTPPIADYLAHLESRGLVVTLDVSPDAIQQFCSTHSFHPNLVGLWPNPHEPGRRFAGFDDDAIVSLDTDTFEVYVEADAHPTLNDACAALAIRQGLEPRESADKMAALRSSFMGTARVVAALSGGYFNRAVTP